MWGRGVDVCDYFGGRGGGNPSPKNFWGKNYNFTEFYRNFDLKRQKNLGGRYPYPLGAMSPLKLFSTSGCGDAY